MQRDLNKELIDLYGSFEDFYSAVTDIEIKNTQDRCICFCCRAKTIQLNETNAYCHKEGRVFTPTGIITEQTGYYMRDKEFWEHIENYYIPKDENDNYFKKKESSINFTNHKSYEDTKTTQTPNIDITELILKSKQKSLNLFNEDTINLTFNNIFDEESIKKTKEKGFDINHQNLKNNNLFKFLSEGYGFNANTTTKEIVDIYKGAVNAGFGVDPETNFKRVIIPVGNNSCQYRNLDPIQIEKYGKYKNIKGAKISPAKINSFTKDEAKIVFAVEGAKDALILNYITGITTYSTSGISNLKYLSRDLENKDINEVFVIMDNDLKLDKDNNITKESIEFIISNFRKLQEISITNLKITPIFLDFNYEDDKNKDISDLYASVSKGNDINHRVFIKDILRHEILDYQNLTLKRIEILESSLDIKNLKESAINLTNLDIKENILYKNMKQEILDRDYSFLEINENTKDSTLYKDFKDITIQKFNTINNIIKTNLDINIKKYSNDKIIVLKNESSKRISYQEEQLKKKDNKSFNGALIKENIEFLKCIDELILKDINNRHLQLNNDKKQIEINDNVEKLNNIKHCDKYTNEEEYAM
ncbi:MAG: toprim domain-containing protein [Psittacicella sp.]